MTSRVEKLVVEFAARLEQVIRQDVTASVTADMLRRLQGVAERTPAEETPAVTTKRLAAKRARRGGPKPGAKCHYPHCRNVGVPRFRGFCAAKHKNLPAAEKNKLLRD